jgi:protoheme IX farnesyltransferase
MGSGEKIDWAGLGWTSLGTYMAAASANAFNQVRK